MSYVATGGISAAKAAEFLDAGARVVALGAAITDAGEVEALKSLIGG
jgi:2-dehydro-3-deoxyphosphogluconate aldolase / (4S)-4-hydroxy-2-oxoglutarate aldolase